MKKSLFFIVLIVLVQACNTSKSTSKTDVTKSDAEKMEDKFPGLTAEKLQEGKDLFENNCNLCHGLDESYGKSEDILAKYVPGMSAKVNKKLGKEVITEEGKKLIFEYLVTINSKE